MLVEGDRIQAVVAAEVALTPGTTVVDGDGLFLIPGLWDMHVHAVWDEPVWGYAPFFPLLVANGVTGIRDTWGDLALASALRARIAAGDLLGPRMVVAHSEPIRACDCSHRQSWPRGSRFRTSIGLLTPSTHGRCRS